MVKDKSFYTWTGLLWKRFENNIEGQYIEAYKTFLVPLDNTKLDLSVRNDSVTPNKNKKLVRDDLDNKESPKDSESSSDKKKGSKKKWVAPISGKYLIPK